MAYTSGQLPERQAKTEAELAARFAADMKQAADENRTDIEGHVRTLYARQQRDPNATLDFLLLSGGGDRGAFGTGFLLGWSTVASGANALPKFDGVSGVSTGAFIAPFAFLGTHTDYEKIDRLFRNPKPDWVEQRGMFFFLPENASLAEVPGLVRDLRAQVDLQFAEQIVQAGSTDGHRVLLIQATDIDGGTARAFDAVAAAREAVATGDTKLLSDILLSSAAIPGAFPPREIQGRLYADGGIASNFFYGGPMDERDTFGATWRREHPNAPIPKTRYWVIINEYIEPVPVTVQPAWPAIRCAISTLWRKRQNCAVTETLKCAGSPCRKPGDRSTISSSMRRPCASSRMRADASAPTPNRGTRRRRDRRAAMPLCIWNTRRCPTQA
jgi:hypothetical protein